MEFFNILIPTVKAIVLFYGLTKFLVCVKMYKVLWQAIQSTTVNYSSTSKFRFFGRITVEPA